MAWIGRILWAARAPAVVGGAATGSGYFVKKKLDEIEESTGVKLNRARKFFEEVENNLDDANQSVKGILKNWLDDEKIKKELEQGKTVLVNTNSGEIKLSETEANNLDLNSEVEVQSDPTILSGQGGADVDDSDVFTKALIKDLENSKNSLGRKADEALLLKTELGLIQHELEQLKNYNSSLENKNLVLCQRIEELEKSALDVELKYQRSISRLEQDVTDLRRQLLFEREQRTKRGGKGAKKVKRQLVDIYSDVLDTLATSGYSANDQLPRIVVVGDQSAGKTSVLEAIAKARLFPRGAGQMMTRSPIKVTLCEGARMEAYFPDTADRIYNLTKKGEEEELRAEIERRMVGACKRTGQTVSELPVNVTVSGPGLKRMVLVDLPGVISTVTAEMHPDTKTAISDMIKKQLANPNAIILCIQDGSVDAERSIVTELVSSIDPKGLRTMFVLTKVDKAEQQGTDKSRVKKILDGKLFPMKALGYHAVVTGRGERGNPNDTIEEIQEYEQEFFQNSQLFHSGLLKPSQLTTQNLASAVSDLFWKMIHATIEQQSDAFKAARFNLETEWKNNFPRFRELDRQDLFEKAKSQVLDQILELPTSVKPKEWETELLTRLWDKASHHVLEQIFLPSAIKAEGSAQFNTMVDIKLKQWADRMLPKLATQVAREILLEKVQDILVPGKKSKQNDDSGQIQNKSELIAQQAAMDHARGINKPKTDPIFDLLREETFNEAIKRHEWDEEYYQTLRVIQLNALDDRSVTNREEWTKAIDFIKKNLGQKKMQTAMKLYELTGPGKVASWWSWTWITENQKRNKIIANELHKFLPSKVKESDPNHLTNEDVLTIRKQIEMTRPDCSLGSNASEAHGNIRAIWYQIYRLHFLKTSLDRCGSVQSKFYAYTYSQTNQGREEKDQYSNEKNRLHGFDEVVLFWRIQKMIEATSNALRQQMMNQEARRLERHVSEVLDDIGDDYDQMEKLLVGRRVTLAEELKKVREVQSLLDEFITELHREI